MIAALFALIRSPRHTHVLITNIINTIVSSMIKFLMLFLCPNKVISLSLSVLDISGGSHYLNTSLDCP